MTPKDEYKANVKNHFERKIKKVVTMFFWVIFGIIAIAGLALLFGYIVMLLWNWLMPVVFGLGIISFWQAVGIIILAKLLFGGFGGGKGRYKGRSKRRIGERIESRLKQRCVENGFSKYQWYDQYWEEEGKAAYEEYVENRNKAEEE